MDERQLSFLNHLPLTRQAVSYAQQRHGDQRRKADGAPIVLHLLEVASLLARSGYPDHVVAAAVLHDVLEDSDTDRHELDEQFGTDVGQLVALVSDNPTIPDEEGRKDDVRERVRRADGEATVVYAADKVSKVRELRLMMLRDPADREIPVRLRRYRKSLAMLEATTPNSRLVQLLRFELEALQELPPAVAVATTLGTARSSPR